MKSKQSLTSGLRRAVAALGAAAVASFTASAATVTINFVDPDQFSDAGYSQSRPTERDLADLRSEFERHLKRLADPALDPAATLKIEMLDIDLAGRFEPTRRGVWGEVRVVRDITMPRLKFRYTVQQGDRVLATGEEDLTDLDFLHSVGRLQSDDRLRYEKALLSSWFGKRFGKL